MKSKCGCLKNLAVGDVVPRPPARQQKLTVQASNTLDCCKDIAVYAEPSGEDLSKAIQTIQVSGHKLI